MDIAAAKCGTNASNPWNCSTPCTICRELKQTKQPAPTSQLQLAILAARLTTKIADNDALFRCNAELAETNLRLQNEVSELRERLAITTSNNADISSIRRQSQQQHFPKQPTNQLMEQKAKHVEEKEWTWEAEDFDQKLVNSSEFQGTCQQPLVNQQIVGFTTTNEIQTLRELESEKQDTDLENENKVEKLEVELEIRQHEDGKHRQLEEKKLKVNQTSSELLLKSESMQPTSFVGNAKEESERMREELQPAGTWYENERRIHRKPSQAGLEEQKEAAKRKLVEDEHEAKESDWISDGELEQFQSLLEEQMLGTPRDSTIEGDRMQLLQKLEEQLQQKGIEMQELEKENRSLDQQLKIQQQLVEGLEKKLDVTEKYSIALEEKNVSMGQEIIDQKRKYEELLMEKVKLTEKVESEAMMKLHEEMMLLKQENENLIVELAKKQSTLDEEKANVKTELINLECHLANRELVLEELKEDSFQMQRQLDDYKTQMSELQRQNEVNQEFHQQLVEAQKKIAELERRLEQVMEQNELLKNGEEKLMDALAISNKQVAETESKNQRLESEISNLKTRKIAKKTDHSGKSVMRDANAMIEVHGKLGTR